MIGISTCWYLFEDPAYDHKHVWPFEDISL
jgi:hypothetical protein